MKIETTRFGRLDIDEDEIITFPKGLPSFEENTRFVLIPVEQEETNPYFFLQSVEEEGLCFFVLDPFKFFGDYQVELDEPTRADLEIKNAEEVFILTMITVKESLQEATTNLRGPLVINHRKRLAKQIVLEKGDYLIKQPLFDQSKSDNSSIDTSSSTQATTAERE